MSSFNRKNVVLFVSSLSQFRQLFCGWSWPLRKSWHVQSTGHHKEARCGVVGSSRIATCGVTYTCLVTLWRVSSGTYCSIHAGFVVIGKAYLST